MNVGNKKSEFIKINKTEIENGKRKKQNINRKLGINNYAYVPNAPRKNCEKCHSSNILLMHTDDYVSKEPELFYYPSVPVKHWDNPFILTLIICHVK